MRCKRCDGWGFSVIKNKRKKYFSNLSDNEKYSCIYACENCLGTGRLDWIENILGIKERYDSYPIVHKRMKRFERIIKNKEQFFIHEREKLNDESG